MRILRGFFGGIIIFTMLSCSTSTSMSEIMECKHETFEGLETVMDVDKQFTVRLPKNWKVNLYTDAQISSIYAADTTKELTSTVLVDFTKLKSKQTLDNPFKQSIESNLDMKGLKIVKKGTSLIKEQPSFYVLAEGSKNEIPYTYFTQFIEFKPNYLLQYKIEIYGQEQRQERLCKAVSLSSEILIY